MKKQNNPCEAIDSLHTAYYGLTALTQLMVTEGALSEIGEANVQGALALQMRLIGEMKQSGDTLFSIAQEVEK